MSETCTATSTYSTADVEATFRRFSSDIFMIAVSTKAITREEAEEYAHDAEYLAVHGYLQHVDVTLLSGGVEQRASRYSVNEKADGLESSRPGGVLWPRLIGSRLRVILSYTPAYTAAKREEVRPHLKIGWVPTYEDTSHSGLNPDGARNYVNNGYGLERKDYK